MAEAPISVFISYSRTDSAFVDTLETNLISRGFSPWVDRRKLEGGQQWLDAIQQAIDRCARLVVVLTPEAVASEYVRIEYRYARTKGKPVIPLLLKPVADPPMDLLQLQWVTSFQADDKQGMRDLVVALTRPANSSAPLRPANPANPAATPQTTAPATGEEPEMSVRELYLAGNTAFQKGDLEGAGAFWEQLLAREPNYLDGLVRERLDTEITPKLLPGRIQRLREQAVRAHARGDWDGEIRALDGLVALAPADAQAQEELPIARHNQSYVEFYATVKDLFDHGEREAAKRDLQALWKRAPYYGDPEGIAPKVGLTKPKTYAQAKVESERQAEVERKRQAAQDARTKHNEAHQAKLKALRDFVRGWKEGDSEYPRWENTYHGLFTRDPMVWLSALALLVGLGSLVGIFAAFVFSLAPYNAWPENEVNLLPAVGAVVVAILAIMPIYRRAFRLWAIPSMALVAVPIVFVVTVGIEQSIVSDKAHRLIDKAHFFWLSGGAPAPWTIVMILVTIYGIVGALTIGISGGNENANDGGDFALVAYSWEAFVAFVLFLVYGILLGLTVGGGWAIAVAIIAAVVVFIVLALVAGLGVLLGMGGESLLGKRGFPTISFGAALGATLALAAAHFFALWFYGPMWFGVPSATGIVAAAAILTGGGLGLTGVVAFAKE